MRKAKLQYKKKEGEKIQKKKSVNMKAETCYCRIRKKIYEKAIVKRKKEGEKKHTIK